MYLLDINVWLALTFEVHGHHRTAAGWFADREEGSCLFCRYSQSGFLRLSTNAAVFGKEAQSLADAWSFYDLLILDPRTGFSQEPLGLDHLWREMTMTQDYSPKVWNDAYLAAFAVAGGFTLATFDGGFAGYKNLECEILPVDVSP